MTPRYGRVRVRRGWVRWLAGQPRVPAVVREFVADEGRGRWVWAKKWTRVG